jgi:hypothetical protein
VIGIGREYVFLPCPNASGPGVKGLYAVFDGAAMGLAPTLKTIRQPIASRNPLSSSAPARDKSRLSRDLLVQG